MFDKIMLKPNVSTRWFIVHMTGYNALTIEARLCPLRYSHLYDTEEFCKIYPKRPAPHIAEIPACAIS